jgi:hypothetical protein
MTIGAIVTANSAGVSDLQRSALLSWDCDRGRRYGDRKDSIPVRTDEMP